ncbi:winged helix-turn-helix transcriptional regulator [Micromonospora thermarum]|uniref:Helix-turn-helix transcriptional regulator n=1 Tax=Micromonospora thermarum TaxID=2720024 RepID=A0ABX0Z6X6_9ACTN|nr:helix-turn-helix domain-containing protein [Micromonospora thermarum]NJP31881.1 helix-turn-helix transcriptional regulator [Micromonospora thermarum]
MTVTCLPECGVARFLALLNGPWATLIVRELLPGPRRFTELREALPGISPHTLTSRLRQFETYGIVIRTTYPEIPPRVEYRLTAAGQRLREVLDAMAAWATSIPDPESHSVSSAATQNAADASTAHIG